MASSVVEDIYSGTSSFQEAWAASMILSRTDVAWGNHIVSGSHTETMVASTATVRSSLSQREHDAQSSRQKEEPLAYTQPPLKPNAPSTQTI